MARLLDSNTLAVRFGILLLGAGLGFGLRLAWPPTSSVLRDEGRSGGARPASATLDPQSNSSQSQATVERMTVDAGSEEAFQILDDQPRRRRTW